MTQEYKKKKFSLTKILRIFRKPKKNVKKPCSSIAESSSKFNTLDCATEDESESTITSSTLNTRSESLLSRVKSRVSVRFSSMAQIRKTEKISPDTHSVSNMSSHDEKRKSFYYTQEEIIKNSKGKYKILIMGPPKSGKTELIKAIIRMGNSVYVQPRSKDQILDGHTVDICLLNGVTAEITVVDIPKQYNNELLCEAIQSVFRQILTTHTNRKVDGFIICYDITQEKKDLLEYSFMIVKNRPMQVFQAIVLVGTKIDQPKHRKISFTYGERLAEDFLVDEGVPFFEVSSLTGENIKEMLTTIVHEIDKVELQNTDYESYLKGPKMKPGANKLRAKIKEGMRRSMKLVGFTLALDE